MGIGAWCDGISECGAPRRFDRSKPRRQGQGKQEGVWAVAEEGATTSIPAMRGASFHHHTTPRCSPNHTQHRPQSTAKSTAMEQSSVAVAKSLLGSRSRSARSTECLSALWPTARRLLPLAYRSLTPPLFRTPPPATPPPTQPNREAMSWGGVGQTLGAAQPQVQQDLKLPMPPGDSVSSLCFAPSDTLNLVAAGSWDGSVRSCVCCVLRCGCPDPSIDGSTDRRIVGTSAWCCMPRTDRPDPRSPPPTN